MHLNALSNPKTDPSTFFTSLSRWAGLTPVAKANIGNISKLVMSCEDVFERERCALAEAVRYVPPTSCSLRECGSNNYVSCMCVCSQGCLDFDKYDCQVAVASVRRGW